jgi:cytochrome c556
MRKRIIAGATLAAVALGMLGTFACATADIDLTDFDDDVMRNMDDTVKSLDSHLSMHDAKSAQTDAQAIREGLHWAEDYFSRKGNVEQAVQFAKQAEQLAAEVGKSAASSDFDAAQTSYDSLVKACRACHNEYKPPDD